MIFFLLFLQTTDVLIYVFADDFDLLIPTMPLTTSPYEDDIPPTPQPASCQVLLLNGWPSTRLF